MNFRLGLLVVLCNSFQNYDLSTALAALFYFFCLAGHALELHALLLELRRVDVLPGFLSYI